MKVEKIIAVTKLRHDGASYVRVNPDVWFFVCGCGCKHNWYVVTEYDDLEEIWQSMIGGSDEKG